MIYQEERDLAFNPEFAESSFSMKEGIVPGPTPQPWVPGSQPTHIQHHSSTNTLPRAQHAQQQHFSEPFQPWRSQAGRLGPTVRQWPFPSNHLSCTFSSLLIENAEPHRAWPVWAQFQMCLLRATVVLLTPYLILKGEKLFFSLMLKLWLGCTYKSYHTDEGAVAGIHRIEVWNLRWSL